MKTFRGMEWSSSMHS